MQTKEPAFASGTSRSRESLPAAYAGGTRMLLISVGGNEEVTAADLLKRAIDAAKAAGVKHIAYTSYVGITRGDTAGRAADHQGTEEALRASGVAWTMLRNSIYMHGQIAQAARMVAEGRGVIPPNESPIGYVTREDCARAAAAVLSTPGPRGQGLRHHRPRADRRARRGRDRVGRHGQADRGRARRRGRAARLRPAGDGVHDRRTSKSSRAASRRACASCSRRTRPRC